MSKPTYYVLGFLFRTPIREDIGLNDVILIKKNKPNWMKGKLNGVGGKVEGRTDKTPWEAMRREFKEETGLEIEDWKMFCRLGNADDTFRVFCFFASAPDEVYTKFKSTTDEWVVSAVVKDILVGAFESVPNIRWLLPMAVNAALASTVVTHDVTECQVKAVQTGKKVLGETILVDREDQQHLIPTKLVPEMERSGLIEFCEACSVYHISESSTLEKVVAATKLP